MEKGLKCTFLPEKVILISNERTSHYFKGTSLPCNNTVAANLSCNKYFLRKILKKNALPTPRTITLRHPAAWQSILTSTLRFPLVVKPINASHANGSTMNITNAQELHRAVERAFHYIKKHNTGNRVLVEEFFEGQDLRLLVVGNRVVSVVRRIPAYVVGDGKHTIRQLIHAFNKDWQSPLKYDLPLCPIPIDSEVSRYLTRTNLTLNTVIADGQQVTLRWNANVSTGGRAIDVTDQVHPRIKALAIRTAKLSHLQIGGVDILCKNPMSGDVSGNNIAILEINDSPGIDIHHFPFQGTGRPVSSDIMDYIFGKNAPAKLREEKQVKTLLSNLQINPNLLPANTPVATLLPRHSQN
jgi:cyanophycin synthetase